MLLYYHKMVKTEDDREEVASLYHFWKRNAEHLEDDPIFGKAAFDENRRFLEGNQAHFDELCQEAVHYWVAEGGHEQIQREQEVLLKAMDGMKDGLCTAFGALYVSTISLPNSPLR